MEKFKKLGISEHALRSIQEEKFENPTEIQEKTIPLIISGRDVIAGAATGSGKTLAFGVGIVDKVEAGKGIQSLILTPTRELAEQVANELIKFSKYKHLRVTKVYGGVSINPQIQSLERADVVVGTPGRILDHIGRETINLGKVKILVLDEADRMLDMGFRDDVEKIIKNCPKERQTLLFSATIFGELEHIVEKHMKDPVEVSVKSYVDDSLLVQSFYDVPNNLKFSLLVHFLKNEKAGLVMVFCNTQRNTDFVANNLRQEEINAFAIHGGYSQQKRSQTMNHFNSKTTAVLVCTDVAARGLDIKGVSHIYNYDLPKDSKEYIHRIGRTARAGLGGKAISLLSERDYDNFDKIIRDDKLVILKKELPYIKKIQISYMDNRSRFGRFNNRGRGSSDNRGRYRSSSDSKRRFSSSGKGYSSDSKRRFSSSGKGYSSDSKRRFSSSGKGYSSDSKRRFSSSGKGYSSDSKRRFSSSGKGYSSDSKRKFQGLGKGYSSDNKRKFSDSGKKYSQDSKGKYSKDSGNRFSKGKYSKHSKRY